MTTAFLTTGLLLAMQSSAALRTLWEIGRSDNAYAEFAYAGKYSEYPKAFPGDVDFRIGRDEAAKGWPYIHPGPTDSWAGSKVHPFRITFPLAEPISGTALLILDLIDTHSGAHPRLQISVNGRAVQIQLPGGAGDNSLTNSAAGREHVLRVPMSGDLLKVGDNTIELTVVGGSWLLYDALRLEQLDKDAAPTALKVDLAPFVRKTPGGECRSLTVTLETPGPAGQLEVTAAGRKTSAAVEAAPLGSRSVVVAVPAPTAAAKAEVVFKAGDTTLRHEVEVVPPRPWQVFIVNHTHSDVGYPDHQAAIAQLQTDYIDAALDYIEATRDYPDDAKYRWACECTWGVDLFLALRSPQRIEALKQAITAGRIEITAMPMNMTDLATEELMIHSLQAIRRLRQTLGAKIVAGTQNDVNGFPLSLPRLLASCGVKYLATGINETRSLRPFDRPTGIHWEAPDGTSVLAFRGEHYMTGDPLARETNPAKAEQWLAHHLSWLEKAGYPHSAVLLQTGGYGTDDAWPSPTVSDVVKAWNERIACPKLRVATFTEFFEALEKDADKLPRVRKAWCDWWADGNGSAVQEVSQVRQAHEELEAAGALLAASYPSAAYPKLTAKIDHAMLRALLFDEHTWGYAGSIDQPNSWMTKAQWGYKAAQSREAGFLSAQAYDAAREARAVQIAADTQTLVIENPSSWPRGGTQVFRIPAPATFGHPEFKLVDAVTGKPVACDKIAGAPIFDSMFAIDVPPVPPLGCRVLRIDDKAPPADRSTDLVKSANTLENDFYRVEVDPKTGVVSSFKDKRANRELAGKEKFGFLQYVHEQVKDPRGRGMVGGRHADAKFDRRTPASVQITGGYDSPLVKSLHVRSKIDDAHTVDCELILYRKAPRLDVRLVVNKPALTSPEAGYLSFPFALDKPVFDIDAVGGTFRPGPGQIDRSASDYHSIQRYVRVSEEAAGGMQVIVASKATPLAQIGDIHTGHYQNVLTPPGPVFYMWLFNNYWFTNFLASQGGELIFEFSLTSQPKSETAVSSAHRFGVEYCMPLPVIHLPPGRKGQQSPGQSGLIEIFPAGVMMTGLTWARHGDGVVMRIREFDGKAAPTRVRFASPWNVSAVQRVNVLEEPLGEVPVKDGTIEMELKPYEMVSLAFKPL